MYYTYILYATKYDRYYVGQTNSISKRLVRHNAGYVKSTKKFKPWKMVYYEKFITRKESLRKETEIKKWKSKKMIQKLIKTDLINN